jgi:hypothetical protein
MRELCWEPCYHGLLVRVRQNCCGCCAHRSTEIERTSYSGLRVRGTCRDELDGITRKLLPSADPSAQYHKPHLSPNQHSKTIAVTVRLDVESYWYLVSHDGKAIRDGAEIEVWICGCGRGVKCTGILPSETPTHRKGTFPCSPQTADQQPQTQLIR